MDDGWGLCVLVSLALGIPPDPLSLHERGECGAKGGTRLLRSGVLRLGRIRMRRVRRWRLGMRRLRFA